MAKKPTEVAADAPTLTKVKLTCVYSGFPGNPGPGDVIEVDAVEAARLIDVGGAVAATEAN